MSGELHFSFMVDRNNLTQSLQDVDKSVSSLVDQLNGLGQSVETPLDTAKRAMDELDKSIEDANAELKDSREILAQFEKNAKDANDAVANFDGIKVDDSTGKLTEEYIRLKQEATEANAVFAEQAQRVKELEAQEKGLIQSKEQIAKSTAGANERIKEQNGVLVNALGGTEKYSTIMEGFDQATFGGVKRMQSLIKACKAFIATPLGAVLAVIVGLFKAVQTYFNSTSEGQEKLAYATGLLEGVMTGLKDVVIAVGKAFASFTDSVISTASKLPEMWDAFKENPLDYVKQAWSSIADYFVNAGTQLVDYMKNLGSAIWSAMKGNFNEAGEAFRLAGEAFTGMLTGSTTEEIHKSVDETIKATTKEIEHLKDVAKKKGQINLEERQLSMQRAQWAKESASIEAKIAEEQVEMYSGTTASRVKASEEMMNLSKKKYEQEVKFAEKELELHKRTMDLGENADDDYKKLWELEANVDKLKAQANAQLASISRRATSLRKAMLKEQAEAELSTMRDGEEKTMKQRKLQEQLELNEIEEAKLRYIEKVKKAELEKAQAQAKARGEAFNSVDWEYQFNQTMNVEGSDANKALTGIDTYTKDAQRVTDKYAFEAEMQAEQAFSEFRSFSDRMLLIRDEYAQKIKVANEMGESASVIEGLRNQEKAQMQALQADMTSYYSAYADMYIDFQNELKGIEEKQRSGEYSEATANAMKMQAEKDFKDQLSASGYGDAEELSGALQKMNDILVESAQMSLEELVKLYQDALEELSVTAKEDKNYIELEGRVATLKALVKDNIDNQATPSANAVEQWGKYETAIDGCISAGKDLAQVLGKGQDETLQQVNQIATATLTLVSNIVKFTDTSISGIESATKAGVVALKTIESASVILAIVGAIIQIGQAISQLSKQKSSLEQIKEDVEEVNEAIEEMKRNMMLDEKLNDTIFGSNLWDDLRKNAINGNKMIGDFVENTKKLLNTRYIDENWNDTAGLTDIGKSATDNFKDNVANVIESIPTELEGEAQKIADVFTATINPLGAVIGKVFRTGDKSSDNRTLGEILGIDTKSIQTEEDAINAFSQSLKNMYVQTEHSTWFRKASYEKLGNLDVDMWNLDGSLNMDAVKKFAESDIYKKLSGDQRKAINEMIESWDAYEQSMEQLESNLSSIFSNLGSNLGDAIEEAFLDGADSAETFKTAVADMLNDLAKQMVVSVTFGKMFEEAQTQIEDLYKRTDLTDEQMMDEQVRIMTQLGNDAIGGVDKATELYSKFIDSLNEAGYSTSKEIEEQNAKYGGYETMSEETGTELSGRFSAMQILQSQQVDLSREMYNAISNNVAVVSNMYATLGGIAHIHSQQLTTQENILSVLRTFSIDASSSLSDIAKYTKNLN